LVSAVIASGCGVRFAACEPQRPAEHLPVRLWSCSNLEKRCEVFARFKTGIDCDLYKRFVRAECDPAAPPGEIRCRETTQSDFLNEWFNECSTGDLSFADVRDGGAWVR
jgi:hypothetical protein